MFICPACENEIDTVEYRVYATEYGRASLYVDGDDNVKTTDFDSRDSEWTDDPLYYCPECDAEIALNELRPAEKEAEEAAPAGPAAKPLVEETFAVRPPPNNLQVKESPDSQTESAMICQACAHVFVFQTKTVLFEDLYHCPACNHPNSLTEFLKLLKTRHFEN